MFNLFSSLVLIKSIHFYQKFISPYKGFKCSHAYHTHDISCSNYGLKVLKENSVFDAIRLTRHRLKSCSHIHKMYQKPIKSYPSYYRKQAGFVDACDCSGADCAPDCSAIERCFTCDACSFESCYVADACSSGCYVADGACNWGGSRSYSEPSHREDVNQPISEIDYLIPNFQYLTSLDDGYLLYEHSDGLYYAIHNSMVREDEASLLKGNEAFPTKILSLEEVKNIFSNQKTPTALI